MSLYSFIIQSSQVVIAAEEAHGSSEGSLLSSMLVEILTVIICFLLVYWILSKFAFGPVLEMIDKRRETIESDLKRAEDARLQAETDRSEAEARLRDIEEEAREKMQAMMSEARQLADSVQQKAQKDAQEMLEKAKQNIVYETEKAREVIKTEIVDLTLEAAEHLIKEKLDDSKHRQLIGDFIDQVERN